ncbi:MAG: PEP-CTERM sorting domain-containing protein [Planctomycetota bacterium]
MDKTFTYMGHSGFSSNQVVEFQYFDVNPNGYDQDFVTVRLVDLSGLGSVIAYSLDYSVQIDSLMAPNTWFATADLDVLHLHDSSLATKDVKSAPGGPTIMAQLTAVNGAPDGPHAIVPGYTLIYVSDHLGIGPGGIVSDMSNTFEQASTVPEPTTWDLCSGLLGAGLFVRRRRRVAAAKLGAK